MFSLAPPFPFSLFLGTTGRSVPQRLYKRLDDILDLSDQDDECYMIQSAPIGYL